MEFSNNINIKYIEFVKKTQYVYYEIEEGNNTYHGIIDIKNNLLIFNTNETIKNIRYFSTNSLLIITEKSAFQFCLFAKDNNNKCIDSCPTNTELILDTEKSNYCGNKIGKYCDHYILKPNDICVPSCDGNIFYIESNYTCGLCKDLFSDRIYKYYNENNCYEKKPNNSIYLNEKLKIFKCNEGYNFENGEYINVKCFKNCELCSEESTDEKEQKCISC